MPRQAMMGFGDSRPSCVIGSRSVPIQGRPLTARSGQRARGASRERGALRAVDGGSFKHAKGVR